MTLIDELGELALSTRLIRLSEWTRRDVSRIYNESGLPFESRWFPVFYVLSKKSPLGVVELADEIGYAHPSVIALIKEMSTAGLVKSITGKPDRRKRMLSLSAKGLKMLTKMEPLWNTMRVVAHEIYNHHTSLLEAVENVEGALHLESYYDRYKKIKTD